MGLEWYLSSMFFMMLVICPFFLIFRDKFSKYMAPVISALALLFIFIKEGKGKLAGVTIMWGWIFKSNVRALAEICLGIAIYELCQYLKKIDWTPFMSTCFKCIEAAGYLAAFYFASSKDKSDKDMIILLLLAASVLISFTGKGLLEEKEWLSSKICFYLGGLSLPIYLSQSSMFTLIEGVAKKLGHPAWLSVPLKSVIYIVGSFVVSIILYEITRRKLWTSFWKKLQKNQK